jgi:3'-phosphoadenosine 5'-phosphosulfate (PAPS) 3'-phosphatase
MGETDGTESRRARDELARDLACVAVTAGSTVAAVFAAGCALTWKGDGSPVTDADLAAERIICDRLSERFPEMPIVSEERIAAGDAPVIGSRFALVDPLDGTREFIAGRKEFTVNVAIVVRGRPVAGAIYAPMLERLWIGGASAYTCTVAPGAGLPDLAAMRRIKVRLPSPDHLAALVSRSHIDPRFGATREWDTAAGCAVLTAAGGSIVDPEGRPLRYGGVQSGFRHDGFVALGGLRFVPVAEGDPR